MNFYEFVLRAFQSDTFYIYIVFAAAYLSGLLLTDCWKDRYALVILVALCLLLGVRDPYKLRGVSGVGVADPAAYAALLAKGTYSWYSNNLGKIDYLFFRILRPVTSRIFSYSFAFLFIHVIYAFILCTLYRVLSFAKGAFYLFAGWAMFINSGMLLLSNFFRQGQCIFCLIILILVFSKEKENRILRYACAAGLPFIHASSAPFTIGMVLLRNKRFRLLFPVFFVAFCAIASIAFQQYAQYVGYENTLNMHSLTRNLKAELLYKIIGAYGILLIGFIVSITSRRPDERVMQIQKTLCGFVLPIAGLIFFTGEAVTAAARFVYYFHALAFLYLALSIAVSRKALVYSLCAIGLCCFGAVTWTYPTIAVLLVW